MLAGKQVLWGVRTSLAVLAQVLVLTSSGEEHTPGERSATDEQFTAVVPLDQTSVTIYDTQKRRDVPLPVVLRRTGRFTHPTRYQLRSADGSMGYVHEVSLRDGGVGWKLSSRGPGNNYLAWVSGSVVGIKEVSKMTDSSEDKPITLRLGQCLPRDNLGSRENAIHSDTEILHVGKDRDGLLRVEVRDPINDRVFRFVFDGTTWRGYTPDGMELPPRWK